MITMTRAIFITTLTIAGATAALPSTAEATQVGSSRRFGIGFVLGDPTGLTAKYFVSRQNALDFGLGFGGYGWGRGYCYRDIAGQRYCDGRRFGHTSINLDYLWHNPIAVSNVSLDWYIGVGGRIWFWDYGNDYYGDEFVLAARAPIGLSLRFANPGFLELFLEIAPSLYLTHGPDLDFDAGFGLRFYF